MKKSKIDSINLFQALKSQFRKKSKTSDDKISQNSDEQKVRYG